MWTSPTLWNHLTDGIQALDSSDCEQLRSKTKEYETVEIWIEEGVDIGSIIKDFVLSEVVL